MVNEPSGDAPGTRTDEQVEALLRAAAAPSEPGPLPGEAEALAAFREHWSTTPVPLRRRSRPWRAVAVGAAGVSLLLTGGVAAAATGSLPPAAQDTASEILLKVGVRVPGSATEDDPAEAEKTDRDGDGSAEPARDGAGSQDGRKGSEPASPEASHDRGGKGDDVSDLARDDETSGAEKGAAVSGEASDGRSRAGEQPGDTGDERSGDSKPHLATSNARRTPLPTDESTGSGTSPQATQPDGEPADRETKGAEPESGEPLDAPDGAGSR